MDDEADDVDPSGPEDEEEDEVEVQDALSAAGVPVAPVVGLETEYPSDPEVARGRSYLEHSRKLFETETMEKSVREINELMAGADWENALLAARQLVAGFPTSGEARTLLELPAPETEEAEQDDPVN